MGLAGKESFSKTRTMKSAAETGLKRKPECGKQVCAPTAHPPSIHQNLTCCLSTCATQWGTAAAPATPEAPRATNTSHSALHSCTPLPTVWGLGVRRDWAHQELLFENTKFRIMLELKNWLQLSEVEDQDSGKPWPQFLCSSSPLPCETEIILCLSFFNEEKKYLQIAWIL